MALPAAMVKSRTGPVGADDVVPAADAVVEVAVAELGVVEVVAVLLQPTAVAAASVMIAVRTPCRMVSSPFILSSREVVASTRGGFRALLCRFGFDARADQRRARVHHSAAATSIRSGLMTGASAPPLGLHSPQRSPGLRRPAIASPDPSPGPVAASRRRLPSASAWGRGVRVRYRRAAAADPSGPFAVGIDLGGRKAGRVRSRAGSPGCGTGRTHRLGFPHRVWRSK